MCPSPLPRWSASELDELGVFVDKVCQLCRSLAATLFQGLLLLGEGLRQCCGWCAHDPGGSQCVWGGGTARPTGGTGATEVVPWFIAQVQGKHLPCERCTLLY